MSTPVKYPVGEQSFEQLRKGGYLYVDKTRFIEKIVNGTKYYFLGRPRRFGKSLFLSTLKCFYEGKRELFKGLHIDCADWKWDCYPVLYLDLNTRRYQDDSKLDLLLSDFFEEYEVKYGIEAPAENTDISGRFGRLIRRVAEKTGKSVVILVDEYDKPLVNNIHNPARFEMYRSELAELYSNLKSSADYIELVFLTGVSRFGKLSVFPDLNNISDISFLNKYSGICGISEEELLENFEEGICGLAEACGVTREKTLAELKRRYDGYHFAAVSPDMYNPYSLLNVFAAEQYGNYWIESGTPTLLLKQLKRTDADLSRIVEAKSDRVLLSGLDLNNMNPVALFYQTGYLTIKGTSDNGNIFHLGLPNDEVKEGFLKYILPAYANLHDENSTVFVYQFRKEMENGHVDDFMARLKSMLAGVGHDMEMENERNVQNVLFIFFKLLGLSVDCEYRTSNGRIDILVRTRDYVYIYIMELKFDKSAAEALDQIERKEYALPWSVDDRTVIGIGINYSKVTRTIDEWLARPL